MPETNVERARRGYQAAMRGDLDVVGDLLDPNLEWHGGEPSDEGSCHNREQALKFMASARGRRRFGELIDVLGAGDKVVVIMRPAPEGDEPASLAANLTTFRDGKAIEMVHFPDPRDALAAAGVKAPSHLLEQLNRQ